MLSGFKTGFCSSLCSQVPTQRVSSAWGHLCWPWGGEHHLAVGAHPSPPVSSRQLLLSRCLSLVPEPPQASLLLGPLYRHSVLWSQLPPSTTFLSSCAVVWASVCVSMLLVWRWFLRNGLDNFYFDMFLKILKDIRCRFIFPRQNPEYNLIIFC